MQLLTNELLNDVGNRDETHHTISTLLIPRFFLSLSINTFEQRIFVVVKQSGTHSKMKRNEFFKNSEAANQATEISYFQITIIIHPILAIKS